VPGLAIIAANLPWLIDRLLFIRTPASCKKSIWFRLLEWLLLYFSRRRHCTPY
jgi:hypothetical protein